jgi:hypothetical protein
MGRKLDEQIYKAAVNRLLIKNNREYIFPQAGGTNKTNVLKASIIQELKLNKTVNSAQHI